jgi:hypothetical protein
MRTLRVSDGADALPFSRTNGARRTWINTGAPHRVNSGIKRRSVSVHNIRHAMPLLRGGKTLSARQHALVRAFIPLWFRLALFPAPVCACLPTFICSYRVRWPRMAARQRTRRRLPLPPLLPERFHCSAAEPLEPRHDAVLRGGCMLLTLRKQHAAAPGHSSSL